MIIAVIIPPPEAQLGSGAESAPITIISLPNFVFRSLPNYSLFAFRFSYSSKLIAFRSLPDYSHRSFSLFVVCQTTRRPPQPSWVTIFCQIIRCYYRYYRYSSLLSLLVVIIIIIIIISWVAARRARCGARMQMGSRSKKCIYIYIYIYIYIHII